jgi:enamine deaminase RidA (YjgF/YER057c/UK114 family)
VRRGERWDEDPLSGGQTSIDARGAIVGVDDVEAQVRPAFANIAAIVDACGGTLADVVALTVYLRDMADLPTCNGGPG